MTVNGQVYLEKWWCFRQFSFLHLSFFHLQFHHLPAEKAEHFILQRGFSFPASSSSLLNGEKMIYSRAIVNRKTNFVRLEWKTQKRLKVKFLFCSILFCFFFQTNEKKKSILERFYFEFRFYFLVFETKTMDKFNELCNQSMRHKFWIL